MVLLGGVLIPLLRADSPASAATKSYQSSVFHSIEVLRKRNKERREDKV
jgi:hypothetical protein